MRRSALATAFLALPLLAQGHGHDGGHATGQEHAKEATHGDGHAPGTATPGGKTSGERPVHHAQPDLPAEAALQFLREANARVAAARAHGERAADEPRPAGAGRYVVAVIGCADAGVDAAALFGLRPEDVLWIANAGAVASSDAADLVAWAAREHRVRLCVVLGHTQCASLAPNAEGNSASRVPGADRRAAAARALAARRRLSLAEAQALVQAEQLRAALRSATATESEPAKGTATTAEPAARQPEVRVVAASLDATTRAVTFLVPRADELPIAPVR